MRKFRVEFLRYFTKRVFKRNPGLSRIRRIHLRWKPGKVHEIGLDNFPTFLYIFLNEKKGPYRR